MHVPQAWVIKKPREHLLVVGGQEVEVQYGGCLRLQPPASPIHSPCVAPQGSQLLCEPPGACEDLDHEGAIGHGQTVPIPAQRPLGCVRRDRRVLARLLDDLVGYRLGLIMLVASFCGNRVVQNGPTAARARAPNRSKRK